MSNYRKTMTEALQEMESLNERMRMPRQLIDTNKEVMIVKKNKVVVIDKKDQDKYMKQGWELAEEVNLDESVIDKVKEIDRKKSAKKIDGVMVDSFTASAISQVYDMVNAANKKKMEKLPIIKLADLAMKIIKHGEEFVPEEVELDEGSVTVDLENDDPKLLKDIKRMGLKIKDNGSSGNSGYNEYTITGPDSKLKAGGKKFGWDQQTEEVDLDEGKMQDVWQKRNAKSLSVGPFELLRGKPGGVHTIKRSGKVIGDFSLDTDADKFVANIKGERAQWVGNDIDSLFTHLQKNHKEEAELDESEFSAMAYGKKDQRFIVKPRDTKGMKGKQDKFKMYVVKLDNRGNEKEIIKDLGTHVSIDRAIGFAKNKKIIEDVELEEGRFIMTPKQADIILDYKMDLLRSMPMLTHLELSAKEVQDLVKKHKDLKPLFGKTAMKKGTTLDRKKLSSLARSGKDKGMGTLSPKGKIEYPRGKRGGYTEEVELDEAKYTRKLMKNKSIVDYVKKQQEKNRKKVAKFGNKKVGSFGNEPRFNSGFNWLDMASDEVKLRSMSLNKRKAFDAEAEYEAIARKLGLDKFEPKLEEVDLDEASARADARRSMRADPDMRQKFSKDVSATDDDIKGASKNIMMQMRKAQSLKGRFDVEFGDGRKVKIPAKIAIAVQQKYNAMRRPAEKEKFQSKVGKSYKDMLAALKEGFASDAQRRAAFASGYKEKGKKNKKEAILDRIDKKLKEKKDG